MKKWFFIFLLIASIVSAQEFKFAVMSDSRGPDNGVNEPVLSALVKHMTENNGDIDFLFFPGDMVNGDSENPQNTVKQLKHWKEVMSPVYNNPDMECPYVWVTPGNHEIQRPKDEANFKKLFQNTFFNGPKDKKGLTYSFDHKNTHFVVVDSDRWYHGNPKTYEDDRRDWHYIKHLDWIENDLREARKRNVNKIFVITHEMAYPTGGHLRDGFPRLGFDLTLPLDSAQKATVEYTENYWNILVEYDVAAHICGHEHSYSRLSKEGVFQIINGSSGAPLYYPNQTYADREKDNYSELSYENAIPYYKALGYNYIPGKNSQISEDFVGKRAFHYSIYSVKNNKILVKTFGAFPDEENNRELGSEIKLIDSFEIPK